jgi:hypothetical protein
MAEAIFFFGLVAAMPLAMWWMISANRKARARLRGYESAVIGFSREAFEEIEAGIDGLSCGRGYAGDGATLPPHDPSGETAGIKGLQGRR